MSNKEISSRFQKDYQKAKEGADEYVMIIRKETGFCYIDEGSLQDISSITIAMCIEGRFRIYFEWDNETRKEDQRNFLVIMKNSKRLFLQDESEGLFAFGVSEAEDNAEKILILVQTKEVSTIIAATKESAKIDIQYHLKNLPKDITQECLLHILHNITESEVM